MLPTTTLRPANERGTADHGWLDARHSFSFADYRDPRHMGFRGLRVLNEDRIAPGGGFGMHPHRDMEIVTYVVSGAVGHRDSLGHSGTIRAGEVQAMSAGRGITHSERNAEERSSVHLLQTWILPDRPGHTPRYAGWRSATPIRGLRLVASPDAADGSCAIHADARMYVGRFEPGDSLTIDTSAARGYWVQLIDGALDLGLHTLAPGDGVSVVGTTQLRLSAPRGAHFLLFDLV